MSALSLYDGLEALCTVNKINLEPYTAHKALATRRKMVFAEAES